MEPGESSYREDRNRLPIAFAAGAVIVLILLGGLFLLTRVMQSHSPSATVKLPFGATEQAYAVRIHFRDIQLAHATNFLNQDFTYVAGTISNDGDRAVRALEITVEFHDPFNQVILRESQELSGPATPPLDAGQHRDFQITLEHLPATWNHENPAVRVTGLILE
jgi:hypothetical protein